MTLTLNHFSVRTTDIESTRHFYENVLGLTVGPRPDFPFPGLWLYTGDHRQPANATVHVIGIDPQDKEGLAQYLGDRDLASLKGSGALDHVAFFAKGLAKMRERLKDLGISARERTVPNLGLHQVFLEDPNGIVVELNYPASEAGESRN